MIKQLLKGHVSPETAYYVDDYPYGYTLRCKIRYWLEYNPPHGFRLVSQTTNPKRGNDWRAANKLKASTYSRFGGAMYLDENDHVQWAGLTEYSDGKEAQAFQDTYGEAVPDAGKPILAKWVAAKIAYEANRSEGDHLAKGLPQAVKAFNETLPRVPTQVKAALIWANIDDNAKHGIRFGMFPAEVMTAAEREGYNGRELCLALMDCAKADGGMRA